MMQSGIGTMAAVALGQNCLDRLLFANETTADTPYNFELESVGKLRTLKSSKIQSSPLSVGFEVLDRKRFDPTKTYDHLGNLGVKWARCQTGWNRCEQTKGEFTFEWLDEIVNSLLKVGVQPWFNLGYGNKLYTPKKPDDTSVGWAPVFEEEPRQAWLRFVGKLADHFARPREVLGNLERTEHLRILETAQTQCGRLRHNGQSDRARLAASTFRIPY